MMRGMAILHRLAAGMACLLVLAPSLVSALELGPIEARSALYEPLDARIPIRGARSSDIEGLKVVLGSPAQFELAGVARLQHLDLLEFVVEQGDGGGYIHVRTDEPIVEPSLTFLVDAEWPRGRTVRGYKLRFNPAVGSTAGAPRNQRVAPVAERAPETGTSGSTPASPPAPPTSAAPPASSASPTSPASPASSGVDYGPVRSAETLWSIAARFRPDGSVSVQRMMLAILEANPEAFEFRNVNALNAGATLRIPTRDDIGPNDLKAAIAEVQRQHSAWTRYREGTRATPVASTSAPEPSPRESRPEPGGRIEVVSPETTTSVAGREESADLEALRKELALSMEDADAGRRENDELKLRLAEAEDHIKDLTRLVALKSEEIAAVQAELRALAETEPKQAVLPAETEPKQAVLPAETEPKQAVLPAETEPKQAVLPAETEPKQAVLPAETEPKQAVLPAETEPKQAVLPAETEPKQAVLPAETEPTQAVLPAETEPTQAVLPAETEPKQAVLPAETEPKQAVLPAEAEPKSLPFGLGALPVNPVFLVGGAGLFLILLGVVALLRRRRTTVDEDDALEVTDPVPRGEDDILLELEAVAAELADETGDPPGRQSRAALAAVADGGMEPGAVKSDAARSGPGGLTEERVAELWQDDRATLLAKIEADDGRAESTFDIDALTAGDSGSSMAEDEASDDFYTREFTDPAAEREADPDGPAGEAVVDLDSLFDRHEARATDSGTPASAPISGAEGSPELDSGILDDGRNDALPVTPDDKVSVASAGTGSAMMEGAERDSGAAADESVGIAPSSDDDSHGSTPAPRMLLDGSSDDVETGAYSLDAFGEDEVQTKIDLAQVYMEMGDTESARGFLEAAMTEGNAEQQDTAWKMLSKLA